MMHLHCQALLDQHAWPRALSSTDNAVCIAHDMRLSQQDMLQYHELSCRGMDNEC